MTAGKERHLVRQQDITGAGRFSCRNGESVIQSLAYAEGTARFSRAAYVSKDLLHVYSNIDALHHQIAGHRVANI
jgi:hypothetical protein